MTSRMRFAIVGVDHWYTALPIAERLAGSDDADLVVVAADDVGRAREVAAAAGARATADAEAVFADDGIDAIISCVDAARNPDVCIRAARSGKHVMSVKPMAMTLEAADAVVDAVDAADVVFVAAESRPRLTPLGRMLRELGAARGLGPAVAGTLSLAGNLPASWPGSADPGWWADPSRTPGGGWIDHAIYQIDRMRWTLGADVASVSGRVARLAHPDLAVEDSGHAVVAFTDGSVVAIEDGWAAAPGAARVAVTLAGRDGSISLDTVSGRLSRFDAVATRGTVWEHGPIPDDDPTVASLVETFRGGGTGLGGVHDAWDNLAACLAFYEAASTGTSVAPPTRAARVA